MRWKYFRRVIIWLSVCTLAASAVFLAAYWHAMPEQIPIHYDAAGQIDAWGQKANILLLPVVGAVVCGMMSFMVFLVGSLWNGPAGRVERAVGALAALQMTAALAFAYITVCSALCVPLGRWFLPVSIAGLALPLLGFVACAVWPARKN